MIVGSDSRYQGRSAIDVLPEEMKHVTENDFRELQRMARGYCRAVDATRSRRRMDGSATAVRGGRALYGTDDVSDDVTQDAVLMFAKRLHKIVTTCEVSAFLVATRQPSAWQYVRRDGDVIVVSRRTVGYWAVRDAAARNGYRLDVRPDAADTVAGLQAMRGVPHADKLPSLALAPYLAGHSETIFRTAWGDGTKFPILADVLDQASTADDLGRAGIMGKTAQKIFGGPRNSSSKVQRTRDAALAEWRDLSASLDAVRDDMVFRSAQSQ